MSFFGTDHLVHAEPAVGKPSGFFAGISQGYEQQYRVDSPYSLEDELKDRWMRSLEAFREATGETYDMQLDLGSFNSYARVTQGEDVSAWQKTLGGGITPELEQSLSAFQSVNQKIKDLNNPEIQSFEAVLEEVIKMQQEIERETGIMSEASGFGNAIGQFIGATAGAFSERDPFALATLGIGGAGRTIAARVATEMGIAGGVTAVTEYGAVQANRELADLPERNPLFDVAVAAAGGGLFQAAGEGVVGLLRRGARRREEAQIAARDERVRHFLETNMGSPRARGALEILDQDAVLRAASPYGETRAGLRRFTAELDEVAQVLGGRAQTAIARVLPEVPFEYIERRADFELVKEQSPEVYARLEETEQAIAAIDLRVAEIETSLESVDLPAAVRLVDEEAADRLDELAAVVNDEALPEPVRQGADLEAAAIIERVGTERVAKALNDAEIAPRKELQTLRRRRRAANRRHKQAFRAVEQERVKLQTAKDKIVALQQGETTDLLGYALARKPILGSQMSHSVVARQASIIDEMHEGIDDTATALVRPAREGEEGIDIGLREDADPNLSYVDENGQTVSFRSVMDDLVEDKKLEEAMKACML